MDRAFNTSYSKDFNSLTIDEGKIDFGGSFIPRIGNDVSNSVLAKLFLIEPQHYGERVTSLNRLQFF